MKFRQLVRQFLSSTLRLFRISYLETSSMHSGTYLGILWLPLSTLIFTSILSLVFHHSDEMSGLDFFLYIITGFVYWQFIQGSITNSTDIIQKKLEFAIHNGLTLAGLFMKLLVDRLFELSVNISLLVVVLIFIDVNHIGVSVFLFFPFLILLSAASISISYVVNIITIFFPDLSALIKTATRFLFFISPVFWVSTSAKGVRHILLIYNPVSYYLSMGRQVFNIHPLNTNDWIIGTLITLLLVLIGLTAYFLSSGFVRNIK